MSARSVGRKIIALAAGSLLAGAILAADRVHVVAAGDSPASLAKKYYGDKELGDLLLSFNGKSGRVVHPGERLTIPICSTYRAKAGDSWSALAKRHFGRGGGSSVLAELNGYEAGEPLRAGALIVLPVVLRHALVRGETLSLLAQRYYGDPTKAALVQEFSRIDDAHKLVVGTMLEIPLVAFVGESAEPAKPEPKAAAAVPAAAAPPPPPEKPTFDAPLASARRSFAEGEYDHARETLEGVGQAVIKDGTEPDRREWGRLLAFVYIALDRDVDACRIYRLSPHAEGPAEFDPDAVSPRIRAVLTGCPAGDSSLGRLDNPEAPPQISPHADTQR